MKAIHAACLAIPLLLQAPLALAQDDEDGRALLQRLRADVDQLRSALAERPRIALFDLQRVVQQSAMGRALERELNEFRVARQAELEELDRQLRAAIARHATERDGLAPDRLENREAEIEKMRRDLQRAATDADAELTRRQRRGLEGIARRLHEAAEKLAEAEGFDLVARRDAFEVASARLDVTDRLIALMDAEPS